MTYTRSITIRLDADLLERLDRAAEARTVSRRLLVVAAITRLLETMEADEAQIPRLPTGTPTPPPQPRKRRWWEPR